MRRCLVLARALAVVCCLLAVAGQGLFLLRVFRLGLGFEEAEGLLPSPWPWVINVVLLGIFGASHSGMAREAFKRRWTHLVPRYLERSIYVGTAGLVLGGLALAWQPLAGSPLWDGPTWIVVFAAAGAVGVVLCPLPEDPARFFGLRQAWQREQTPPPETLRIRGPYRYVRHPLMACLLIFLWAHPVMPPTLALLSGGMTLYILAGVWLEERDLLRRFGAAYAEYRRRVPALIPWRGAAPRGAP